MRIRLNSTGPFDYRVIGIDRLGREGVYEGRVVLSNVQKFLIYCVNNNLPLEKRV